LEARKIYGKEGRSTTFYSWLLQLDREVRKISFGLTTAWRRQQSGADSGKS